MAEQGTVKKHTRNTAQARPRWCSTIDGQAVDFFARHKAAIDWTINRHCIPQQDRDDIRQEVAVRLINRFRRKGPLASGRHVGYAIRVARNACLDHIRKEPPAANASSEWLAGADLNPEQQLVRLQGHERLHRAVAALSPLRRYVVRQVMAGSSLIELSDELERSYNSVKLLHHRAVKDLRKILKHR